MNANYMLADLSKRGVRIWAEAGRLEIDDVSGVLTDDDIAILAAHKSALLATLAQQQREIREKSHQRFDGSLSARIVGTRLEANHCPQCGGWLLADHPECGSWCGDCRYNWLPVELDQMRATITRWRELDSSERSASRYDQRKAA